MRAGAAILCALLAGCSATTRVQLGSDAAVQPPPGSAVSGARVGIDIRNGSSALAAAAALGILFALDRDAPAPSSLSGSFPEMAPGRDINAQDCTRPIERPSANLLCK